jgi:flagellar hook-basal body complex protein FliE
MAVNVTGAAGGLTPSPAALRSTTGTAGSGAGAFSEALGRLVEGVEASTRDANGAVSAMLDKTGEVHDAMIALHQAEMSLQLTVQVRNKFVNAYQEIMRMPI